MFNKIIIVLLFCCYFKNSYSQKVAYHEHIAPIIRSKCAPCHRPGEAGPFSLLTYADVAKRTSFIRDVVSSGFMPPWKPDNHYRLFANDRSLTDSEKKTIISWIDNKAPEGVSKNSEAETNKLISGTQYSRKPDITLKVKKAFVVKGDNEERFIVFKIPFEMTAAKNVAAMEFVSANKKIIHHANFAIHPVADNIDINQAADFVNLTDDSRINYDQYLLFKKEMTYYGGWIPGTSFESYPADLGWVMPKRGVVLLTVHYAPLAKDEEDISGINLFFKETPIKRVVNVVSLGSGGVGESSIDPYFMIQADSVKKFNLKILTPQDQSLLYIWPHMHLLGKSFKSYAVTAAGDTIKLISIPSWDFRWQEIYRFNKLIKVPKGSVLTIEGTYDNTKDNPSNPNNPPKMVFSANDMKSTDEMLTMLLIFLKYEEGDENKSLDILESQKK
ncbi:copper type II ascorbate-dependent monooxygenase-like protein [Pedobacter alluvionis]|uniref:Copper type II ascorbate-dependent monooxygenase-like protein n=1 Tax=Pedobacter alluvionis TaxID=475253 RepID=A0A497Y2Q5_9SPHI|nr:copper type II ascorbate-dependent monooxygenase-like protein [Pedobacter alluvionis]TFB33949.1 cytochrome c [Pedobacter alluvionis]